MIKEALEYLSGQANNAEKPEKVNDKYGREYVKYGGRFMEMEPPMASPIGLINLDGVVDFINEKPEKGFEDLMVIIHDQHTVSVESKMNEFGNRSTLITARAMRPTIHFDRYMPLEEFTIMLQSTFVQTEEVKKLIETASFISVDSSIETMDDGVSQKVAMRNGITTKKNEVIKSRVTLTPIRTFVEIPQPKSEYLFRLKKDGIGNVTAALFEADGGIWKMETMREIKKYLDEHIEDTDISVLM